MLQNYSLILELCHSAHPMLVMDYPVTDLQLFYTEGVALGSIPACAPDAVFPTAMQKPLTA